MAQYRISGIWINSSKVITHYAFHSEGETYVDRAVKTSKARAIEILETKGNSAVTWTWNYKQAKWNIGEKVEVINGADGKYLRSNPDDKLTDNLAHLIDFDWITSG